jgi:hypothetical protein
MTLKWSQSRLLLLESPLFLFIIIVIIIINDMQFAKLTYVVKTASYLNNLPKLHKVKIKIYLILWASFGFPKISI